MENITWNFILDNSNLFLVVIDNYLKIRLINKPLYEILGFRKENDIIKKNWLSFINTDEKMKTSNIYTKLLSYDNDISDNNYKELINNIILPNNDIIKVKWYNLKINETLILSIGFKYTEINFTNEINDIDSFRNYYQNIIHKNQMIIKSYQDSIDFQI
jgi:hypothetical protein